MLIKFYFAFRNVFQQTLSHSCSYLVDVFVTFNTKTVKLN